MFNPTALRKTKIVYNFGLSECNRVKGYNFGLSECNRVKGNFNLVLPENLVLSETSELQNCNYSKNWEG